MKKIHIAVNFLIIALFFIPDLTAQSIKYKDLKNYAVVEFNYMKGLESQIDGIRITSAYYLGEMESENAVNYLLDMLHYDKCLGGKIVAAFSLMKIGNPLGISEVKKMRQFNLKLSAENEECIRILSNMWDLYLNSNPTEAIALKNIKLSF